MNDGQCDFVWKKKRPKKQEYKIPSVICWTQYHNNDFSVSKFLHNWSGNMKKRLLYLHVCLYHEYIS